jgi:hypothetical protein
MPNVERASRLGRLPPEKRALRFLLEYVRNSLLCLIARVNLTTRAIKVRGYESDNFSDPFLRALG